MTDEKLLSTITRRQVLRAVALVPLGALLASCAPASPSTSNGIGTSTGAAPGSAAPKSTRSAITFPIIAAPGTLNPIKVASTAELQIAETIHGSLVRLDPTNFEPKPYLAESWETAADGLTWTFHLRKGVKFHDGQDCTAEDVKFTMDQMLNPKVDSARGRQFLAITETRVVDPLTVQFTLSSPWAALPTILAGRWAVAPKHILESLDIATDTTFDKKPIGIGPYMLSEWVAGDHLTLTANKSYFLGPPKIDTVIFKVLPDASVQVAQLRTSEVDAIPFFSDASIPAVKGQPGLTIDQGWGSIFYAVHLNMNRVNLFGDKRVRQALSYAIDRQAIIDNVLGGNGKIATGPIIPQITWAYDSDVAQYPFDPARAKDLLRQAGFAQGADGGWSKDGTSLSFPLAGFQGNSTVQRVATLVQQYWADIGVKTDLQIPEFSTFVTNVRDNRGADGYSSFVSYMTPDAEPDGIYAYFSSSNAERGSNFTAYKNPEVDRWLDIGRRETDRAKRKEAYDKVQEILAEDQTRIFLFYPPTNLARRENVSGLSAVDTYYYLENAYFV